jgi:hypothetical protein
MRCSSCMWKVQKLFTSVYFPGEGEHSFYCHERMCKCFVGLLEEFV